MRVLSAASFICLSLSVLQCSAGAAKPTTGALTKQLRQDNTEWDVHPGEIFNTATYSIIVNWLQQPNL